MELKYVKLPDQEKWEVRQKRDEELTRGRHNWDLLGTVSAEKDDTFTAEAWYGSISGFPTKDLAGLSMTDIGREYWWNEHGDPKRMVMEDWAEKHGKKK